jgi:hypothetical protein
MKYFGKKSLSSFLSGFLHAFWYVVLVVSIITTVIGTIIMFSIPVGDNVVSEIAKGNLHICGIDYKLNNWEKIKNLSLALKIIMLPYFGVLVVLLLQIIKKSQQLFTNFKNDILFNKSNVLILSKISKLNIGFSILTFNLSSMLVAVFLLMLCEIFKSGAALQEEHDFTV